MREEGHGRGPSWTGDGARALRWFARAGRLTGTWTVLYLITAGLSALAALIVARGTTIQDFGHQSSLLGVAVLLAITIDHGVASDTQRLAAVTPASNLIDEAIARRFAVLGVAFVLAGLLAGVGWTGPALAVTAGAALATATLLGGVARGRGSFTLVAVSGLLDKSSALAISVAALSRLPEQALLLGTAGGALLQIVILVSATKWRFPGLAALSFRRGWRAARSARSFFGVTVLNESQRLDVPLVQAASSASQAGLFAAPARVANLLGVPALVISSVLLTKLSASPERTRTLAGAAVAGMVSLYACLALLAIPSADDLVHTLLGSQYIGAAPILVLYCFAMVPQSVNQIFVSVLAGHRLEHITLRWVGLSAGLMLVLVTIGAARGGALGAGWAFLASQSVLMLGLGSSILRRRHALALRSSYETEVTAEAPWPR